MFEQIKELYIKTNKKHIQLSQKIIELSAKREELISKQIEEFGSTRQIPLLMRFFSPQKKERFQKRKEAIRKMDLEIEQAVQENDKEFDKNQNSPLFRWIDTEEQLQLEVDAIIKKMRENHNVNAQLLEEIEKAYGHVIISEKDKFEYPASYGEYALVHLTDYIPKNNQISRMIDKNAVHTIEGSFGSFQVMPPRETTHFCVNCPVPDANLSSWQEKKYAVIIPIMQIPKDAKIASANSADFIIKDKVKLTKECYIICNEKDYEEIKKENLVATIIAVEKGEVYHYIPTILNLLDFAYLPQDNWGFINQAEEKPYKMYIENRFGKVSYIPHNSSLEKKEENVRKGLEILKGIEQGILEGKCLYNDSTKRELKMYYEQAIEDILKGSKSEKNDVIEKLLNEFKSYLRLDNLEQDEQVCIQIYEKQLEYLSQKMETILKNDIPKKSR